MTERPPLDVLDIVVDILTYAVADQHTDEAADALIARYGPTGTVSLSAAVLGVALGYAGITTRDDALDMAARILADLVDLDTLAQKLADPDT